MKFLRAEVSKIEPADRRRVLEFGSLDMNGTAREVLGGCPKYVGVDWRPGKGVDVVCLAHEYRAAQPFDVGVCTEMLEHDPHWRRTLAALAANVRRGGVLLITCAGPAREEHELDCAPAGDGEDAVSGEHYRNLTVLDLVAALPGHRVEARYARDKADLQAVVRVGG